VILVKTAFTEEFVTGKVCEDYAEQNRVLINKWVSLEEYFSAWLWQRWLSSSIAL